MGVPASTAPTLSVDAKLVNIPVVVHDKHGALVQNLTKDSFQLWIDNKQATIRYFNLDTDLPLTLGLLVDTSMSQRNAIDDERKASSAFFDDMLSGPAGRDKAFLVQFSRQADLLQDVTSSKPKLQQGLQQLSTPGTGGDADDNNGSSNSGSNNCTNNGGNNGGGNGPYGRNGGNNGGNNGCNNVPVVGATRHGGTTLYDALFLSSDELMKKQTGRKALIILSDGDDRGSKESLASSIEAAQRADTIVYAIYFKGTGGGSSQDRNQGGGFPGGRGGGYPGGGVVIPVAATRAEVIPAAVAAIPEATEEGAAAIVPPNRASTARRSCSVWPTRPADGSSSTTRRTRWPTSTSRSARSCARNIASATRRTRTPPRMATTASRSRSKATLRTSSPRPATATTPAVVTEMDSLKMKAFAKGMSGFLLAACFVPAKAFSQSSPRGTASLDLRGRGNPKLCPIQNACSVSVEYGRPSLNGRTVDEVLWTKCPPEVSGRWGLTPPQLLRLKTI